jgi:hypothetical protein
MTDTEIRIAIAEACGNKYLPPDGTIAVNPVAHYVYWESTIPDYPNDLNAIHEAEKVFLSTATFEQESAWLDNLYRAIGLNPYVWRNAYGSDKTDPTPPGGMVKIANASARHRAKAFLRTIGKWKEDR